MCIIWEIESRFPNPVSQETQVPSYNADVNGRRRTVGGDLLFKSHHDILYQIIHQELERMDGGIGIF